MAAAEFTDLYEILQVSPNAEKDTIKRVHQMLSLKYQLAAPENNAVAYFAKLQEAAATLLDSQTRAAYDLSRQLASPPVQADDQCDHRRRDHSANGCPCVDKAHCSGSLPGRKPFRNCFGNSRERSPFSN